MFLRKLSLWGVITWFVIAMIILLASQLIFPLFTPVSPMWAFIETYWLADIIIQSSLLVGFTAIFTMIIGVSAAYFMTFYQLKYRKLLEILLVLPLGIPAYVLGYIYTTMTSVTGSIHLFFTAILGELFTGIYLYQLSGAVLIFTLTLYPYVYLASRAFLMKQPSVMIDAAKTLGASEGRIFFKVLLPLLRPALVGSVTLVIMEVLNDYGLVHYLGLRVYATAIFQTWFNGNDLNTAVRLAGSLIVFIIVILMLENLLRKHRKYAYINLQIKPITRSKLSLKKAIIVYGWLYSIIFLALILPVIQLIFWSLRLDLSWLNWRYFEAISNSLLISFYATVIILILAISVVNYNRYQPTVIKKMVSRLTNIGYSIPGTVIALAVILLVIPIDRMISEALGFNQLIITTSIITLVFALVIRFLAVSSNLIESAYQKIGTKFTSASYALGRGKLATFFSVDLPLINHGLIAAALIVIIDLLKELPLTLILRPFNVQTLATRLFQYAGDEQIIASSPYALTLIILTGGAVWFASDMILKVNRHES
jgi:iron(III) transport system permease protein